VSGASAAVRDQLTEAFERVSSMKTGGASSGDLAAAYGDLGVLLLAAGYYDTAETALLHARAGSSQDARWPYYLGHVYRLRSEPERSIGAFQEARALKPGDVTTLVRLAEAQLSAGRSDAANATLGDALRVAPQDARVLATLGRAALSRRDYASAIRHFEDALRVEPQATALHYQLSLAYRGAGDTTRADAELLLRGTTEPAARDPLMELAAALDSASMYDTRSRTALTRGDWATAISEARRGLELRGTNPTVRAALHHRLGTALAQTGDSAGAEREFKASIAASPDMARAHYSLGVLRLSSGQTEAALRELSLALEADPTYLAARVTRADVLRRAGRAGESLAEYDRALELEPKLPAAQFGAAVALASLGRHPEARDRLTEAIVDHPGDRALTVALARLLAASSNTAVRDPGRALTLVEPVVRTGATWDAVETMTRAFAELGRFEEAAALQGEAVTRARDTGEPALASAMAETQRLYQQRRVPRWLWRAEPVYEPTPVGSGT
jgi:tetratricopeptide (TPR) repeat protein